MGNRAVITTKEKSLGIYLHWNGGYQSVLGFTKYCKYAKYRCPSNDCYGWAYLAKVIGNYFGDGLSVGIDIYDRLDKDNGDNGVYIIDRWEIVGREFMDHMEQSTKHLFAFMLELDDCQPEGQRLGKDLIREKLIGDGITPEED